METIIRNPNHPKKGSVIRVDPIRNIKDIKSIRKLLADQPRNLALFILGTNTNLRASDMLEIKAGQVCGLKPMDEIEIRERKTGKHRRITLNKTVVEATSTLLATFPYHSDDLLFRGQRGPLTVPSLTRLVKSWCKAINLQGNFGSHSLRKTWGYHQRVTFSCSLPELMICFNHSTQKQTLDYLCIQPKEIRSIYANEI